MKIRDELSVVSSELSDLRRGGVMCPPEPVIHTRSHMSYHIRSGNTPAENRLSYRDLALRKDAAGLPATVDEEARTVEVLGATEDPVLVFDYERFEPVMEVLLMDGAELPKSRQCPLLDTHQRWDGTRSVMGSFRDMKTENGQLIGRAHFSSAPEADGVWTKVREGHVTDFSVGYRVVESTWIPDGQKQTIKSRTFEGPMRVTTRWRAKEMSVCPIGADENAKARMEQGPAGQKKQDKHNGNQNTKEHPEMNPKLKAILVARGLAADATDEAAWKFFNELFARGEIMADGTDPSAQRQANAGNQNQNQSNNQSNNQNQNSNQAPDPEAARAETTRAERARINEISAMVKRFGFPEDRARAELLDVDITVDRAREMIMKHLETTMQDPDTPAGRVGMGADEKDKFRQAAEGAILLRSGISGVDPEKLAPGAGELSGHTLVELARHSLRISGQRESGHLLDVVGRALTTSDFPLLLANVANKSLDLGWESAEETWEQWCATGSVNDFKTHTMPRVSEFSDLDEIPEDVEYKYGKRTEAQEQYRIATYGKLGAVSRQTIINDDLNAITSNMMGMGESAARKIADLPYAVLTGNAAMGDGTALFHADHGNYLASGGIPDVDSLNAAEVAMGNQKDLQSLRRLNIRPVFFLAPRSIKGYSEQFFKSNRLEFTGDTDAVKLPVNPWAEGLIRIYESRLDDDSDAAWYLAARKGRTVKVFFLGGIQRPYFEIQNGWTVDGTEYKVRIDAGAKAVDWKGLYYNNGE